MRNVPDTIDKHSPFQSVLHFNYLIPELWLQKGFLVLFYFFFNQLFLKRLLILLQFSTDFISKHLISYIKALSASLHLECFCFLHQTLSDTGSETFVSG